MRLLSTLSRVTQAVLLSSVLAVGAHAQDDSWPFSQDLIMSPSSAPNFFLGFAQGYAASRGYRISEISQRMIVEELEKRASDLDTDAGAQFAAELGLIQFVDAMIASSNALPGVRTDPSSFSVLGEQNFVAATRSLCPIWPICD